MLTAIVSFGVFPPDTLMAQQTDPDASHVVSAEAKGIKVAYRSQNEIRSYFKETSAVYHGGEITYAKEPVLTAPYSAGELSEDTLEDALLVLNRVRYVAGLDPVSLDQDYTSLTQAACLVNAVNNQMSHFPSQPEDMDDALYQLGAKGAGSSNIGWGYPTLTSAILEGWMDDGDSSNISRMGHRRWLLNPTMEKTGFGMVKSGSWNNHSAVYAFDRCFGQTAVTGVVWPAQNMPIGYFDTGYPWTVSTGREEDLASVKVSLTRLSDNQTWVFEKDMDEAEGYFNVNNDGYGQTGCIIFRPNADAVGFYGDGDCYQVWITGLAGGEDISYQVTFFDPERECGDVNGDKQVNEQDVTMLSRYLVGKETLTGANLDAADVNCDGTINNKDAAYLARYLAGKEKYCGHS